VAERASSAGLKRVLPYLAVVLLVLAGVNFLWFWTESAVLGGDALNGYRQDAHYFIGSHGSYREVEPAVWEWSRIHGISVFVTHPLGLLGGAILLFGYVFPSFMGPRPDPGRVRSVVQSGPKIAAVRTGGRLGMVNMTFPLLHVSVHPGGVVLRPLLMDPRAILASEIGDIAFRRMFLAQALEIYNDSPDVPSPVLLYLPKNARVARALMELRTGTDRHAVAQTLSPVELPTFLTSALNVYGLLASVAFVAIGILWAIPNLGVFGVAWTALMSAFAIRNLRAVFRRRSAGGRTG